MRKILFFVTALFLFVCCNQNDKIESNENLALEFKSVDGTITLFDPVMRPSAKGMNSAIFLTIKNNSSNTDTLYSVESDIAELVEIHETYKVNKDKMGMRHVDEISIPSETVFLLKPGSYHIMLIDLIEDVLVGKEIKAKLIFKHAGKIEFTTEVKNL